MMDDSFEAIMAELPDESEWKECKAHHRGPLIGCVHGTWFADLYKRHFENGETMEDE